MPSTHALRARSAPPCPRPGDDASMLAGTLVPSLFRRLMHAQVASRPVSKIRTASKPDDAGVWSRRNAPGGAARALTLGQQKQRRSHAGQHDRAAAEHPGQGIETPALRLYGSHPVAERCVTGMLL